MPPLFSSTTCFNASRAKRLYHTLTTRTSLVVPKQRVYCCSALRANFWSTSRNQCSVKLRITTPVWVVTRHAYVIVYSRIPPPAERFAFPSAGMGGLHTVSNGPLPSPNKPACLLSPPEVGRLSRLGSRDLWQSHVCYGLLHAANCCDPLMSHLSGVGSELPLACPPCCYCRLRSVSCRKDDCCLALLC